MEHISTILDRIMKNIQDNASNPSQNQNNRPNLKDNKLLIQRDLEQKQSKIKEI